MDAVHFAARHPILYPMNLLPQIPLSHRKNTSRKSCIAQLIEIGVYLKKAKVRRRIYNG